MEFNLITIGMIVAVFFIIIFWIMWSAMIGAGFQPTSKKLVKKMLEIAEIGPNDVLYDLSSGDGRIVTEAVEKLWCQCSGN